MPAGVALELCEVVADALDSAAQTRDVDGRPLGMQHRDLKPSNIMLTAYGQVKLLDFGVAQACFEGRESSTQSLQLGTVDYMPPERLAGGQGSPAADVYSLGVVLWEVLAAERLGRTSPQLIEHRTHVKRSLQRLRELRPELPNELDGLLEHMLSWSPVERPSAAALVERASRLARACGDPPLRAWCRAEVRGRRPTSAGDDPLVGSILTPSGAAMPTASGSWEYPDGPSWDDRTAVGVSSIPVATGSSPGREAPESLGREPVSDAVPSGTLSPLEVAAAVEAPGTAVVQARRRTALIVSLALSITLLGGLLGYLFQAVEPPEPVLEPASIAAPSAELAPTPEPPHAPPREPSPPPDPALVPSPAPIVIPGSPSSADVEADAGAVEAPASTTAPGVAGGSLEQSPWDGTRPGGSLSTAGLEAPVAAPDDIWGSAAEAPVAGVAWTEGVQVKLTGDATEVVLVNDERGFPVPGVVPPGSWFARVRFGSAEPVVAGMIELEGPGPRTLACDAKLSWCSLEP